jgi:hypothetical protein
MTSLNEAGQHALMFCASQDPKYLRSKEENYFMVARGVAAQRAITRVKVS